jgi:AcrR family transcriptional regulator
VANDKSVRIEVPARARKQPRQDRSVALVEALRAACLEILRNDGRDALTVNAVAERAGVSVSSLYEYYPTTEALLTEIFGAIKLELRNAALDRLRALPADARLIDGIETVLRVAVELLDRMGEVDPEFLAKYTRYDELVRLDLILSEKTLAANIVDALFVRFDAEITVQDRDLAGFLTHQSLLSLMRAIALLRPEYLHHESALRMLGRMIEALLTEPRSARDGSAPREE